jgi:thiamine pyrophosphokinase
MTVMRVLVGGPVSEWPDDLKNGQLTGQWAAADRGALRLLRLGITPVLTVGDFDSLADSERAGVLAKLPEVISAQPEKDETDTELLLATIDARFHPDRIDVYGATGGRLDQLLSNLWIFSQPRFQELATRVRLIDRGNVVSFFLPGRHEIIHEPGMRYLGFMNLTSVTGLSLIDEKYQLRQWSGEVPFSFSSNEFVGEINHFSFETGMMMVIQSRDMTGQTGD